MGWSDAVSEISKDLRQRKLRILLICALVAVMGPSHWLTPVSHHSLHAVHVLLRKLFILPTILAAVWFELRGALMICALITVVYVPHVLFQWAGNAGENINQVGELGTVWLVGVLAGALVRKEKQALVEVAQTHEGSLLALVAALDAREHQTELHSLRVRAFALRTGGKLGMKPEPLRILGQAAILHDVGKIGVPDRVLLKPGPLDEQERAVMQRHPEIGRRILSMMSFLAPVAEVVNCHHEKYDGTGYPRGLAGERIPFAARVFAVTDVFDALTSDRPYRSSMAVAEAQQIIRDGSGSHFDPQVVNAFLSIPAEEWGRISLALQETGPWQTLGRPRFPGGAY